MAYPSMSLEVIGSWGDWLRLTDTLSDLSLTGPLSSDQVPQLTAYCWNYLDAKC